MAFVFTFSGSLSLALGALPDHSPDIDADGDVSFLDVNCYMEAVMSDLAGEPDPSCQARSDEKIDVNCDGQLNILDIQWAIVVSRFEYVMNKGYSVAENPYTELVKSKDEDLDWVQDACEV